MEAFLVEAKPWALRQARKRFPHIPQDLYEDVYQQACIEMWQRGPTSTDKRSMYAYLAKVLTGTLGRAHKQWVHDHGQLTYEDGEPIAIAVDEAQTPDSHYDRRQLNALLSELMNRRLLAPEKAVLQLQLGAGLDPDQVREALDMTPRQYKRRRSEGLEKLRGALDDYLHGKVCEDHAGLLAMAATGDLPAGSAEQLHAHLEHCGACRAEIKRLRSTVAARFAFAPWPIAIAAPGLLAAKVSAFGAWIGGTSKAAGAGTAAKLATAAATVAVVGGGTAAVVTADGDEATSKARPAAATVTASPTAAPAAQETGTTAGAPAERRAERRAQRRAARRQARNAGTGTAAAGATATPGAGSTGSGPASNPVDQLADGVRDTVGQTTQGLRETTDKVTDALPELPVPTPDIDKTVDDVTGVVDGLIKP